MFSGLVLMGAGMLLYAAVGPQAEPVALETAFVLAGAGLAFNTGPAVGLAMAAARSPGRAGLGRGQSCSAGRHHRRCRRHGHRAGMGRRWGGHGVGDRLRGAGRGAHRRRCRTSGGRCRGIGVHRYHAVIGRRADEGGLPCGDVSDSRHRRRRLAALAALLADPARCKVLLALDDGRAPARKRAGRRGGCQPVDGQQSSRQADRRGPAHRPHPRTAPLLPTGRARRRRSARATGPDGAAATGPLAAGGHQGGPAALRAHLLRPLRSPPWRRDHGKSAGARRPRRR